VVRLIVTGDSLTRRPKRSLFCLLVEIPWQINEYLNHHLNMSLKHWSLTNQAQIYLLMCWKKFINSKTTQAEVIWTTSTSELWKESTLWKRKGSKSDPQNYCALQMGSIYCKTLIILILNRFTEWYESQLLDFQKGFKKGRGT